VDNEPKIELVDLELGKALRTAADLTRARQTFGYHWCVLAQDAGSVGKCIPSKTIEATARQPEP